MIFLIDVHHIGGLQTGNETWARNISRELSQMSIDDEFRFATTAAGQARVMALTGQAPERLSDSSIRRLAVDLPAIARRTQADAMLVQYTKPITRRPCVVMIHDLSPFDPRSVDWLTPRFRARVRASINHSARTAAAIVVPSEFTARGLTARYGLKPDRIFVAPNAVDADLAALLDAAPRLDERSQTQRVIAVGNVLPRKNLTVLGAAIAQMRASGADVELRVVGAIPESGVAVRDELQRVLGDAISFTGYVSDVELAASYASADVLAFPSLFEGFGIPAIEAMYAGVPVAVSDAGSLPEVVADAGVVVAASDVSGWASALTELLTDADLRRRYRDDGRVRASSMSWPTSAEAVLAALHYAVTPTAATQTRSTS